MSCERKSGERERKKAAAIAITTQFIKLFLYLYKCVSFWLTLFFALVILSFFWTMFRSKQMIKSMDELFLFLFIHSNCSFFHWIALFVCVLCGVCYKAPGLMKIWSISTPNVSWICVAPEHCGEHPFVSSDWP